MTKYELIRALQELDGPDDMEVKILMEQWIPGSRPAEEIFDVTQVKVHTGGVLIGIYRDEFPDNYNPEDQ